ncbi:hypothetical protein F6U93_03270 [Tamlana haliotis]|uniref:Lipoprotein n=1 Tax=Pseudotamlana haliotis TaxID=2614804 RepID=A0A6N6MJU7_9FLAO|nr:hypothetical protein [Tamlana haliotis]KAB1069844.1 hypothetical protein F6U93_03270 [Tamlana haliotis]
MRKLFFITLILTAFISCKNESKPEETTATYSENELTTIKGDFVYFEGAGVLQSHNTIYGVLDSGQLKALVAQADKIKTEPTDMVQVEIKGKVTDQKDDVILWENKVEIVEIINVKPASKETNNIVKLGNQ